MAGKISAFVAEAMPSPAISRQPETQTAEAGATVDFSVPCSDSGFTYQLFFNGTNLVDYSTDGRLQLNNAGALQSGTYTVVVTNLLGSVTSSSAGLQVTPPVPRRPVPALDLHGETGSILNVEYRTLPGP
ncbi:MAG TPA: immunoglobulin domain-containing protein [Verrucomicrobiae bacterium]